jgi:uncharacterized protein (TIGR00297 family)
MTRWGAGTLLAAPIALGAYRAGALTRSGALAAWVTGTLTFGTGGVRAAGVLLAFFVPCTLLSRIAGDRKRAAMADAKAGPRDGRQVLANGGVAAVCLLGGSSRSAAAFAGALAAASADTWGTEIGTASRVRPRSIVTFEPVAAGMSGGVTALGSIASAAGSACVAAAASATGVAAFWPVAIAGVAGALADSLLGATVQERRWCPKCALQCETDPHFCGSATEHQSGLGWLSNDAVNLAATLTGAAVAAVLA